MTKSRALKTQDKTKNNPKGDELRRERNKVNNPTSSKNTSTYDRREKLTRNKKPSIRLTDNPKSSRTPITEDDLAEESFSSEPQMKLQMDYVKQNFKEVKELESHSELSPIKVSDTTNERVILDYSLTFNFDAYAYS